MSSLNSPASGPGDDLLPIGEVAKRTGLAVSAVRFYEEQGLVHAERASSGHRRFTRSTIRRLSFIRICQQLGYPLAKIAAHLDSLPEGRTPTDADWQSFATQFAVDIEHRISELTTLRERLDGCIGCGCLSLRACALYNPGDTAARFGDGPRYLLGDSASDIDQDQ